MMSKYKIFITDTIDTQGVKIGVQVKGIDRGSKTQQVQQGIAKTMDVNVIVSTDQWILEQIKDVPIGVPPPTRSDVSGCYWMVHTSDDELIVGKERLPNGFTHHHHQVFRLSLFNSMSSNIERGCEDDSSVGTQVLYRDDVVCIWEFRLQPQARCQYHRHTHPYVYFNLTESLTQELNQQGDRVGAPRLQRKGQSTLVRADQLGEHAVVNVGEGTFLQFIVEFIG